MNHGLKQLVPPIQFPFWRVWPYSAYWLPSFSSKSKVSSRILTLLTSMEPWLKIWRLGKRVFFSTIHSSWLEDYASVSWLYSSRCAPGHKSKSLHSSARFSLFTLATLNLSYWRGCRGLRPQTSFLSSWAPTSSSSIVMASYWKRKRNCPTSWWRIGSFRKDWVGSM